MGFLATIANTVLCGHGGKAQPTAPNPRVRLGGKPIVTQPPPYLIAGCPHLTEGGSPLPCVSALWPTGALRLRSMGQALLLDGDRGVSVPNGVAVSILPGQTRVRGR
ncbi:hypothetical protein [Marilutibacter maris]|uniref:Uncharacterized protein n=1 Tax=Marilutibacter maris TaxID=1605891 RepID=A0A2U9T143_9GAMM|nr:hypothetical protein [Lysobacter maris]AWV06316.1 hypothetical protein C9I47_0593 [Lysobacter maris]